jgi:hypothetical protein
MQITFPGPDGTPISVADTRREPVLTKPGKDVTISLPQERRKSRFSLLCQSSTPGELGHRLVEVYKDEGLNSLEAVRTIIARIRNHCIGRPLLLSCL